MRVEDRQTGNFAEVPRPLARYLASTELIELEQSVRSWFGIASQESAEQDFDRLAAGNPDRVLYGLLWLTATWGSLCAARIGITVEQFMPAMSYRGPWRDLSSEDEKSWEVGEQAIRRGISGVLTSDEDIVECLRIFRLLDPSLLRLRWILLAVMDGLTQGMERNGLSPWGAAAHIVSGAGWD